MAEKRSKRYRQAVEKTDLDKNYSLLDAATLLKSLPPVKFDQTVTVSCRLGIDPRKSDQMVRGTVPLPHGSGKLVRVLVFAQGDSAEAARAAGAENVGYEDMIAKVKAGFLDFDVAIATPDAMAEVRKLGRQLGPRGLMPNPKTGTVTDDTASAIAAVKAGRADYKLDKNGNVSSSVGKLSFTAEQIVDNATAFIDSVVRAKPASAKGRYVKSIHITATMSPGLSLEPSDFVKA